MQLKCSHQITFSKIQKKGVMNDPSTRLLWSACMASNQQEFIWDIGISQHHQHNPLEALTTQEGVGRVSQTGADPPCFGVGRYFICADICLVVQFVYFGTLQKRRLRAQRNQQFRMRRNPEASTPTPVPHSHYWYFVLLFKACSHFTI